MPQHGRQADTPWPLRHKGKPGNSSVRALADNKNLKGSRDG
jgi:hypothetical protein